jgi:hypothetical protein
MEMTALQFLTLAYLIEHKSDGIPFVELDLDPRTIRFLTGQDWIVASRWGIDGKTLYQITGRGEKAHGVFAKPGRRFDGICPECGERPKAIGKNGYKYPYCLPCEHQLKARRRQLFGDEGKIRLCPDCGLRVVKRSSTGTFRSWCAPCEKKRRKEERRRRNQRYLALIKRGDPPMCRRCKEQPRHLVGEWVSDYCYQCYRDYQNEYNRRRESRRNLERA